MNYPKLTASQYRQSTTSRQNKFTTKLRLCSNFKENLKLQALKFLKITNVGDQQPTRKGIVTGYKDHQGLLRKFR